jgi:hypothetical protein
LTAARDVDISKYEPSWAPGAHVPHRWITHNDHRISLLSLLPANGFALLAGPNSDSWRNASITEGVTALCAGQDFNDDTSDWTSMTGLPDDGALLVRPDGHIACRFGSAAGASMQLRQQMARVLAQ